MAITLREFISQHFDSEELRTLCFDLGVEYDDLRGDGRTAKARELVALMERLGRDEELAEAVRQRRREAFEEADVVLERERIPVDQGDAWWRWDGLHVGLLTLVLVTVGALIVIVAPWRDGEKATAITTPTAAAEAKVPGATETRTPPATATPTPTPTPSSTPTPSATPTLSPSATPTPTAASAAADVLIAEFDARHASRTIEVARRLETDLESRLREYGLRDVNVKVVSQPVTSEDEAQSLAKEGQSKVVVWGWYDDAGIQVRIFLAGEGQAGRDIQGTRELPLTLGGESTAELSFVVRDVLPDNVSFLSLFVIGHLYYYANQYQAGHDAYDAAMDSMPDPDKVELANEALFHFFRARQLEAAGSEDLAEIVCGYAQALKLDPELAEVYNNLGIIYAQHTEPAMSPDLFLSEEAQACMTDAGLDPRWFADDFFDRALQQKPDWAVATYNKLGFYWENMNLEVVGKTEIRAGLEEVVQRDPTILGAFIVLGNIAIAEEDVEAVSRWYNEALKIAPAPAAANIHFNLGQVYLQNGEEAQAEAEFEAAVVADAGHADAHLALANLAYSRGLREAALEHLEAIPAFEQEAGAFAYPVTAEAMAGILRSRAYFDAGEVDRAIRELEELVSAVHKKTPLENYLLGLLYALKGDEQRASEWWDGLSSREIVSFGNNASSAHAWVGIYNQCEISSFRDQDWGPGTNPCLPTDLTERIGAVYDLFQDRLPFRLYYREEIVFAGMACPYVFTYDGESQEWLWDTTILYKLVGAEQEALQRRRLARFDGRLLVREVEPEISYIDQLYVVIAGDKGQEQVLPAPLTVLQEADGQYLVLRPGDEVLLDFEGYAAPLAGRQVWVVAKGYYVPLWDSVDVPWRSSP